MTEPPQYSTENWTDEDYLRELNALRNAYIQTIVLSAFEIDNNPFKKKLGLMPSNLEAFKIATQRFRRGYAKTNVLFMTVLPFGGFGPYCTYDGIYESIINSRDAIKGRISLQFTDPDFLPFLFENEDLTKRELHSITYPETFQIGSPENVSPDCIKGTIEKLFKIEKRYDNAVNMFILNRCLHIIEHAEIQKALTEDLLNLGSKKND